MNNIKRRDFITIGSVAAIGRFTTNIWGAPKYKGELVDPDKKINVAVVGLGGRGNGHMKGVSEENIVAVCDVDDKRAYGAPSKKKSKKKGKGKGSKKPKENSNVKLLKNFPDVKKYKDYRKMIKEMHEKIDGITIATPDHMHYPIAKMAIEHGIHVYVEKPLAHTVWETRDLRRLAKEYSVISQMGNQGHTNTGTRIVKEWIEAGAIGKVREVNWWTNRPIWPQGQQLPTTSEPVPEGLDWNLWLGVAPNREYNKAYMPFKWRGWWDFGCGALGDMGCHIMDAAYWGLGFGFPESIETIQEDGNKHSAPNMSIVTFKFPARGDMPPVTAKWYDGTKHEKGQYPPRPEHLEEGRKWLSKDNKSTSSGTVIIGDKASIWCDTYAKSVRIFPETKMQEVNKMDIPEKYPRVPTAGNPFGEWIAAIKGGPKCGSNFEYSAPFSEMVLLGNSAIRLGKKIEWDADKMICKGLSEANKIIKKEYRKF